MNYLQYLTPIDAEITIEKLDKVAKTLSARIKNIAKLFVIFLGWSIFNVVVSLFFHRTRSLSLEAYRIVNEGLRQLATQDILFVLTLIFDDKLTCVISLAMVFVLGVAFFVRFLNLDNVCLVEKSENQRNSFAQSGLKNDAYVVSYKQQVAFLA